MHPSFHTKKEKKLLFCVSCEDVLSEVKDLSYTYVAHGQMCLLKEYSSMFKPKLCLLLLLHIVDYHKMIALYLEKNRKTNQKSAHPEENAVIAQLKLLRLLLGGCLGI